VLLLLLTAIVPACSSPAVVDAVPVPPRSATTSGSVSPPPVGAAVVTAFFAALHDRGLERAGTFLTRNNRLEAAAVSELARRGPVVTAEVGRLEGNQVPVTLSATVPLAHWPLCTFHLVLSADRTGIRQVTNCPTPLPPPDR